MTSNQLFERRAERGHRRGAAAVWADASAAILPPSPAPGAPVWGFRLVMACAVLLGGLGLVVALDEPTLWSTGAEISNPPDQPADESATPPGPPAPDPVVVSGMELVSVFEMPVAEAIPDRLANRRYSIFADPDDPFAGPVIGIDHLDGTGFRVWGANLDGPLSAWSDRVVRNDDNADNNDAGDGGWVVDPSTGLVLVADLAVPDGFGSQNHIQLNFLRGDQGATLQAWTNDHFDPGAGLWAWLAMTGAESAEPVVVRPVTVLGGQGIVIEAGTYQGRPIDTVYWFDDNYTYRLVATTESDQVSAPGQASFLIDQLERVDAAQWQTMVDDVRRVPVQRTVGMLLLSLLALATILSAAFFLVQGPRKLALIGLLPVLMVFVVDPDSHWVAVVILAAALGGTWFHRSGSGWETVANLSPRPNRLAGRSWVTTMGLVLVPVGYAVLYSYSFRTDPNPFDGPDGLMLAALWVLKLLSIGALIVGVHRVGNRVATQPSLATIGAGVWAVLGVGLVAIVARAKDRGVMLDSDHLWPGTTEAEKVAALSPGPGTGWAPGNIVVAEIVAVVVLAVLVAAVLRVLAGVLIRPVVTAASLMTFFGGLLLYDAAVGWPIMFDFDPFVGDAVLGALSYELGFFFVPFGPVGALGLATIAVANGLILALARSDRAT